MEFKTLFYVIAIIAWLVFKFLEKQKSLLKKIAQAIEPPVSPINPSPAVPVSIKQKRLPLVKKAVSSIPVNKTVATGSKKIMELKQQPFNAQQSEVSESPSLIDEIRGGNVDWRKAILLSEILRPV